MACEAGKGTDHFAAVPNRRNHARGATKAQHRQPLTQTTRLTHVRRLCSVVTEGDLECLLRGGYGTRKPLPSEVWAPWVEESLYAESTRKTAKPVNKMCLPRHETTTRILMRDLTFRCVFWRAFPRSMEGIYAKTNGHVSMRSISDSSRVNSI